MSTEEINKQILMWKQLSEIDSHPGIRLLASKMLVKLRAELWRRELEELEKPKATGV